jgi:hypothetical protein
LNDYTHLVEKTLKLWACPSNLLRKLIHGSFASGGVVGIHHNDVDVWVHWRWAIDSWSDWFSYYMCLGATRIYSMDVTKSFLNVDMIIKTHKMWFWQEVGDPQS